MVETSTLWQSYAEHDWYREIEGFTIHVHEYAVHTMPHYRIWIHSVDSVFTKPETYFDIETAFDVADFLFDQEIKRRAEAMV